MPVELVIPPGIFRVRLPLPFTPDHVNCYLLTGGQGWKVIDAGLSTSDSCRYWKQAVRGLGLEWQELRAIYVTHYHPDHYGAAGWLQRQSGAPVYMLSEGLEEANRAWGNYEELFANYGAFCYLHGIPDRLIDRFMANLERIAYMVYPQPLVTAIDGGGEVKIGGLSYRVLRTPGHAGGHLCLYCEQARLLFSGDHLLPAINSNIGLWRGGESNPLDSYLRSLRELTALPIEQVLPAHGNPFGHPNRWIETQVKHHRERLRLITRLADPGANAYQICRRFSGRNLTGHEIQFVFAETLAYLAYLEQAQVLESAREKGAIFFRPGKKRYYRPNAIIKMGGDLDESCQKGRGVNA